jgi:ribosomal protein S18 acetylase RimI-like enzyme
MEFTLSAATPSDYQWLWELKRLTMRPYVEQTWGSWDDEAQEMFFRRNFSSETVQLILVDGTKAGLLEVAYELREVFLANIQIHPDFQNRGLGAAVIRNIFAGSQMLHLPVRLQVLKVNRRAQQLYLRLGFSVYSETPIHVLMRRPVEESPNEH